MYSFDKLTAHNVVRSQSGCRRSLARQYLTRALGGVVWIVDRQGYRTTTKDEDKDRGPLLANKTCSRRPTGYSASRETGNGYATTGTQIPPPCRQLTGATLSPVADAPEGPRCESSRNCLGGLSFLGFPHCSISTSISRLSIWNQYSRTATSKPQGLLENNSKGECQCKCDGILSPGLLLGPPAQVSSERADSLGRECQRALPTLAPMHASPSFLTQKVARCVFENNNNEPTLACN